MRPDSFDVSDSSQDCGPPQILTPSGEVSGSPHIKPASESNPQVIGLTLVEPSLGLSEYTTAHLQYETDYVADVHQYLQEQSDTHLTLQNRQRWQRRGLLREVDELHQRHLLLSRREEETGHPAMSDPSNVFDMMDWMSWMKKEEWDESDTTEMPNLESMLEDEEECDLKCMADAMIEAEENLRLQQEFLLRRLLQRRHRHAMGMTHHAHLRLWNLLWHPIWKQQRTDAKEKGLPFPRGPPTSPFMVRVLEDEIAGSAVACDPPSAPYPMSSGSPQTVLHTTAADAVSGSTQIAQVAQAGDVASSSVRFFNIATDDDDASSLTTVDGEIVVSF